jgi:hypothetical protein
MEGPNENLLSRLEQSLRQSRAARMHLAARLRELETEADTVRAELAEMDTLASQTEAAIYRLLSTVLASGNLSLGLPSDAELEAAMRQSPPPYQNQQVLRPSYTAVERRQQIPTVRNNVEALSDRFMDRTIPQAVTLLLREEGAPLHVMSFTTDCLRVDSSSRDRTQRSALQSHSIAILASAKLPRALLIW